MGNNTKGLYVMTVKKITRVMLARACPEPLEKFRTLFPRGVVPTHELCLKHAMDFNFDWAAHNLLPSPARKACDEARALARKAFDEARALASKAYDEAVAPAWKAYDEARARKASDEAVALAWKAVDEATALARKAYHEAMALTWKACDEAMALAFFRQWEKL